jgi:hypothetical protein
VITLHPQSLGANRLYTRGVQLAGLSLEPSHKRQFPVLGKTRTDRARTENCELGNENFSIRFLSAPILPFFIGL